MHFEYAAAVNDHAVLNQCLLSSPDIKESGMAVRTYEGYKNISSAYNDAIEASDPASILILAHQDVYLPEGFEQSLRERITQLETTDPDWGAIFGLGMDMHGEIVGQVWSSSWQKVLGMHLGDAREVQTADEYLIVLKPSAGKVFDEGLPGFHIYATDLILNLTHDRGQKSYVVNIPVVHHEKVTQTLDSGYHNAYSYMQKKWDAVLPIKTMIATIKSTKLHLYRRTLEVKKSAFNRRKMDYLSNNPSEFSGKITWL